MQERGVADPLTLQRLKRKKLRLKDRIALIEDRLFSRHHRLTRRALHGPRARL